MKIRPEQADDIQAIRKVNIDAFETESEANLVDALRSADIDVISLVAEQDGEVIGHIMFSPVSFDADVKAMGLAPMAVLPAWQGKGVGSRLVVEGLRACEKAGYKAVVVLGHPAYYPRFGFIPSVKYGIASEYDVPPDVFMVKELKEGSLKGVTGTVRYHPMFNQFE